jgi:hypothetical protein
MGLIREASAQKIFAHVRLLGRTVISVFTVVYCITTVVHCILTVQQLCVHCTLTV